MLFTDIHGGTCEKSEALAFSKEEKATLTRFAPHFERTRASLGV